MAQAHALKSRPAAGAAYQLVAGIKRAWTAYWTNRARRGTVLLLRSLDSRTLKDIGIDRSEIESVVYGRPDDRRH